MHRTKSLLELRSTVVLAYSGGLDTSVCIKWLQERYSADVVTVTLDLGQQDELKAIEDRARLLGVKAHYTLDVQDEFVSDYVFPAIRANAMYQGKYPLSTALGRPLIAKKLVEVAVKEGADSVAHGCTGKGNDQVRMEVTVKSMDAGLRVIAPVREWNMSRDEEIKYAIAHHIPIKPSRSIYSVDQNLWGRSIESGPLEMPDQEPPADVYEWTRLPEEAPDAPGYLDLEFTEGVPTAANGSAMGGRELIGFVTKFAGSHGVGAIDHVEDRLVGIKSREVYECPAAVAIIEAHRDLEKLVLTRNELSFKSHVESEWSWLIYSGLWLDPLRADLDRFIEGTQSRVTGSVRLKLYKGNIKVVGRSSPYSVYDLGLSTYNKGSTFDQRSAEGFIQLWGLQARIASDVRKRSDRQVGYQRKTAKAAE